MLMELCRGVCIDIRRHDGDLRDRQALVMSQRNDINVHVITHFFFESREGLYRFVNVENNHDFLWPYYYEVDQPPCHLVPSSGVRTLATTAVVHLRLSQSLASHLMLLMESPFMVFILSSHLVLGLPRLLFPLISSSMTSFSIPRSCLAKCPKYLRTVCATLDAS